MFGVGFASGVAASAAVAFHQFRQGKFGKQKFTFLDEENLVYSIDVKHGFFVDTLTLFTNLRTDEFIYDNHLDQAEIHKYSSLKPIDAKVERYYRHAELDHKLRAARVPRSADLEERKAAEMVLLKIIKEF